MAIITQQLFILLLKDPAESGTFRAKTIQEWGTVSVWQHTRRQFGGKTESYVADCKKTYPMKITRVGSPTYDPWDEPPSSGSISEQQKEEMKVLEK